MSGALLTVLMAAAGTALLAFVGFRLGLSVDRRFKSVDEVVHAVRSHYGVSTTLSVLMSRNQRAAIAYSGDQSGYVALVLGDKLLFRSLDQAKIMGLPRIGFTSLFPISALSLFIYMRTPMTFSRL